MKDFTDSVYIRIATLRIRIATLRDEVAANGDKAMVAMCDRAWHYELYEYDTAEAVTPEDLGVSITQYVEAICKSIEQGTGVVVCGSHMVYAE